MFSLAKNSIVFAPMEGHTDSIFRWTVQQCFPEWDLQYTDFLRLPTQQMYRANFILKHYGENFLSQPTQKTRNILQILCPAHGLLEEHAQLIAGLGIQWLDFNLGCPSKTVNGHKGGSYLLQDLPTLKIVLQKLRKSFPGTLTTKIRTGYNDTRDFDQIVKMVANAGLDALTVHARTRAQQYNGPADWSFIKRAVELVDIPIIGNGDIWDEEAAIKMLEQTGCHAVMAARGALKTPWLARRFKRVLNSKHKDHLEERNLCLPYFFYQFHRNLVQNNESETTILKRFKSVSRFMFDDYPDGSTRKSALLRSQHLEQFQDFMQTYFVNS